MKQPIRDALTKPQVVILSLALAISLCLLWLAGCQPSAPNPAGAGKLNMGDFVGNSSCRNCHPSEFASWTGTRHAMTLSSASSAGLGSRAPGGGAVPLAGYEMREQGGRLSLIRSYPQPSTRPLDYALGSGKTGMTYIALVDGNQLMEARMSYFPEHRQWEITPGQELPKEGDSPFGRTHSEQDARRCLGCHSSAIDKNSLRTAPDYYGVGCESCHGPGRAHVDAMMSGKAGDIHMERLGRLSPVALNERCGKCHRSAQQVQVDTPEAEQTHRFQPFALLRSRCRTADNSPLPCLGCHTAHNNATTDRDYYNRICMQCHSAGGSSASHGQTQPLRFPVKSGRKCPVNSTARCIDCHMRPKKMFPIPTFPGTMADHLISIPVEGQKR